MGEWKTSSFSSFLDFFDQRGVNIDDVYNNILWHSTNLSYLPSEKLEAIKISRDEFVIDCQIKNYTFPPNYINCLANMEDITTNEYAVCQKIKLTVDQVRKFFEGRFMKKLLPLFVFNYNTRILDTKNA